MTSRRPAARRHCGSEPQASSGLIERPRGGRGDVCQVGDERMSARRRLRASVWRRAGPVVAAVDPDGRQAELARGHVIVEQALRDMEDAARAGTSIVAKATSNGVEARLVGPRVLGGDDPVEGRRRAAGWRARRGRRSQFVITPSRNRSLQPPQGDGRVVERRPRRDRRAERRGPRRLTALKPSSAQSARSAAREHVAVGQVVARLERGLVARVALEQIVLGRVDRRAARERAAAR